jgi:hypothetical protein
MLETEIGQEYKTCKHGEFLWQTEKDSPRPLTAILEDVRISAKKRCSTNDLTEEAITDLLKK